MFDSMRRTLTGAWRSLRGAPRYAVFSIALLALGIAATTTVFALLKVTLIDPLPYPAQHQLLHLHESKPPEFPRVAAAGAVVGLILALLSGRVLEGMVFGISTRDPWTLISIALGMMIVAAAAAVAPALRATRIEPMTVLRGD